MCAHRSCMCLIRFMLANAHVRFKVVVGFGHKRCKTLKFAFQKHSCGGKGSAGPGWNV